MNEKLINIVIENKTFRLSKSKLGDGSQFDVEPLFKYNGEDFFLTNCSDEFLELFIEKMSIKLLSGYLSQQNIKRRFLVQVIN